MSLKKKLEDRLFDIEDGLQRLNEKTGNAEKRFVDKHADQFDRWQDRKDQAGEKMGKAVENAEAYFARLKESFAERRAKRKYNKTQKH